MADMDEKPAKELKKAGCRPHIASFRDVSSTSLVTPVVPQLAAQPITCLVVVTVICYLVEILLAGTSPVLGFGRVFTAPVLKKDRAVTLELV
eukprot:3459090-Amphidinium_carterae.2